MKQFTEQDKKWLEEHGAIDIALYRTGGHCQYRIRLDDDLEVIFQNNMYDEDNFECIIHNKYFSVRRKAKTLILAYKMCISLFETAVTRTMDDKARLFQEFQKLIAEQEQQ